MTSQTKPVAFSSDIAWLAEFAKFKHPVDVWNNLQLGMRERRGTRVGRQRDTCNVPAAEN